ncbi:hypothetical protein FSARC_3568 [Fusarium sarcochroum]|uniref:Xylanolytic transcriptional activator regulatory domain-containing protein n=1 Tax=Fusarium sarcochroum TaxID=1208366 RepID=A0A8H4U3U3_9HYPO|nr:hypothetical protein FSARC_3568 [Fusarium sarcochroum]
MLITLILVGSAAGSTFARIFFKQLNLVPSWTGQKGNSLEQPLSEATAALPPQPIARSLLNIYIARVHIWWPFLQLPYLRRVFQHIYEDPRQCTDQEKFVVFIVLALGSCQLTLKDNQSPAMMDLNDPNSYFQTTLRFFNNFHTHPRDLFGIQAVLLLAIWMLDSSRSSHNNDLWQLSRYIMSAAIEAGLHRHNTDWGFTPEELEIRNRTWWCAYNLERQVAGLTGRVLSIRDHAIHALLPNPSTFDSLSTAESSIAPIFHKHTIEVVRHMIVLRRISGRILESIYIARGPNGTAMDTTFQQICATSDQIRRDLELWEQQLESMTLKPSHRRPLLWFHLVKWPHIAPRLLLLQLTNGLRSLQSMAFQQYVDVSDSFMTSSWLDWLLFTAIDLINRGVSHMKASYLERYRDLFQAVRNKVYAKTIFTNISSSESTTMNSNLSPGDVDTMSHNLIFDPDDDMIYSMGDGVEAYVNQVNEFLDGGGFNVDEALDAWYDALMGEIQSN